MTERQQQIVINIGLAFAIVVVALSVWAIWVGVTTPILMLYSFGAAPVLFWRLSKSTLKVGVWSLALCSGEIIALTVRSGIWRQQHGMSFLPEQFAAILAVEVVAILLAVGFVLSVLHYASHEDQDSSNNS